MRPLLLPFLIAVAFEAGACASTDLLDRIAVKVGKDVITEGEIIDEIRVTAFLNSVEPDLSAASRRREAERLVDQYLIRQDMHTTNYPRPAAGEGDKLLGELKGERFPTAAKYQAALAHYKITAEQLRELLLWQVAALRFTESRFGTSVSAAPQDQAGGPQTAPLPVENSLAQPVPVSGANSTSRAARQKKEAVPEAGAPASPATSDDRMESWLKDARRRTRIEFVEEAFQ